MWPLAPTPDRLKPGSVGGYSTPQLGVGRFSQNTAQATTGFLLHLFLFLSSLFFKWERRGEGERGGCTKASEKMCQLPMGVPGRAGWEKRKGGRVSGNTNGRKCNRTRQTPSSGCGGGGRGPGGHLSSASTPTPHSWGLGPLAGAGRGEEGGLFHICLLLPPHSNGKMCFLEIIFKTEGEREGERTGSRCGGS